MTDTYAGNPASYPANITTIEDSDDSSGILFSTPLEQLGDRTAYLKANAKPDVQTFAGNGVWTKPAGASFVSVLVVGAGGNGGIATSSGGGGGSAGEAIEFEFPAASLPASLTITFGGGGTPRVTGTGIDLFVQPGNAGGAPTAGAAVGINLARGGSIGAGGAGGSGTAAGADGKPSQGGGAPGAGGAAHFGGGAGRGYGAGGGGGGQVLNGGGGGAGGWGNAAIAGPGSHENIGGGGGAGAQGVVIFTAWRDL